MKRFLLSEIPVHNVNLQTVVPTILSLLNTKTANLKTVSCLNLNNLSIAKKDLKYKKILRDSDLVLPDGWGIVWLLWLKGIFLRERTTTMDFWVDFCTELAQQEAKIYFLGAKPDVIKKAVQEMKAEIPNLNIVGFHHGHFSRQDGKEVVNAINHSRADILIVGMGTPLQEKWIYENRQKLQVKLAWGVGAVFDYLAGEQILCPRWIGRFGFEWLWRLLFEPKRLWKRYTWESFAFISSLGISFLRAIGN